MATFFMLMTKLAGLRDKMNAREKEEPTRLRYPTEADDDWDDEDCEEDEFESFDCHRDRHGYCGKAGSEECEFECPYNRLKGIKN